jgi:lipoate-protein ligase A
VAEGDVRWQHLEGAGPAHALALEEGLLDSGFGPWLLTWSWATPVLVLGFGQDLRGVDLGFCRRERIAVLRRCSGGTGVVHRDDLSASLVLPPGHPWSSGIRGLYDRLVAGFARVLDEGGVPSERPPAPAPGAAHRSPICFEDRLAETLLVGGRKVLGCAQARRASGTLVHGTLLLSENSFLYGGVFQVPQQRVRGALGPLPGGPHDPAGMARELAGVLAEALGGSVEETPLDPRVRRYAKGLMEARRSDPRWFPLGLGEAVTTR